jgi:hypothetical protein
MAGTPRRVAAALLVVLLPLTLTLWVSLVFLLQLEVRNRLAGSPGESSPLYLALLGLPAVALVSVACLAAALFLRASTSAADITRGLLAAAAHCWWCWSRSRSILRTPVRCASSPPCPGGR